MDKCGSHAMTREAARTEPLVSHSTCNANRLEQEPPSLLHSMSVLPFSQKEEAVNKCVQRNLRKARLTTK